MKGAPSAFFLLLPAIALALLHVPYPVPYCSKMCPKNSRNISAQQQSIQPGSENHNLSSERIFSGKIVKAGNKFVLSAADASDELDDQEKARDFLNGNVKVRGTLDPSTGTIRVNAIEPV
ncbi:MAG: DUF5818 domain-containing protein [Terriglobales bacterium]